MEAHIGGFPPNMSTKIRCGCLELPRQERLLLLGEESVCAQNNVQSIQGSLARDNQLVPQILGAPLVQPVCATILVMHAFVQFYVVDVEGKYDKNNKGDSSGFLQFPGSQLPICFVKNLAIAHLPLSELHGSHCPSLNFVAPDDCYALMLSYAHEKRSWGGGNNVAYHVWGVLRICEWRICGNQNIVQDSYVCQPNCGGHMLRTSP